MVARLSDFLFFNKNWKHLLLWKRFCFIILSLMILLFLFITGQTTTQYQPTLAVVAFGSHSQIKVIDVEIMGIFYWNTPCEIPLEEGEVIEIKVSLGGYEPWIKRVNIYEGLEIRAKLHKKPISESSDSNVKVNVGVQTEKSDKTDDMIQMEKVD